MCGIFGYIGKRNPIKTALEGLKLLEYRGYDSAGIGGISNGKVHYRKKVGKVSVLEDSIQHEPLDWSVVISQTRWATHGKVTDANAHPHVDAKKSLALVHNGIIENYEALKQPLLAKGISFASDTDSEVVAQLIGDAYQGDILETLQQVVQLLKGAYALVLIHQDYPDQVFAIAHEAPLVIGIGTQEAFISSDPHAFAFYTREVIYLSHSEIAVVKADCQQVFNATKATVSKKSHFLDTYTKDMGKGKYEHFTLKEIHEQPQTIRNALGGRIIPEFGTALFEELSISPHNLSMVDRVLILGCGTSWHAGYVAAYLLEDLAHISAKAEISSESRYKNPIITPNTCVIAISQSGETADTLSAVRELRSLGAQVISVCNAQQSTLARESDSCLLLKAGPEIGVLSTKAFTSQVVVLSLFTLMMARMRNMDKTKGLEFLEDLVQLPDKVQQILNNIHEIEKIANKYASFEHIFFIGRNYMYPTALEGALKLKESSYINANAYPAGELKHGPIALIDEKCATVALCANKRTSDKMASNIMEVKARKGPVLAIVQEGSKDMASHADDVLLVPKTSDPFAVITTGVALQLLSYFIARARGTNIDQPRNLAKSVTVE